ADLFEYQASRTISARENDASLSQVHGARRSERREEERFAIHQRLFPGHARRGESGRTPREASLVIHREFSEVKVHSGVASKETGRHNRQSDQRRDEWLLLAVDHETGEAVIETLSRADQRPGGWSAPDQP